FGRRSTGAGRCRCRLWVLALGTQKLSRYLICSSSFTSTYSLTCPSTPAFASSYSYAYVPFFSQQPPPHDCLCQRYIFL
ncbi:hypothetical protein K435DRAFT_846852, partial [Dendrothele bispora CBS 962.96]